MDRHSRAYTFAAPPSYYVRDDLAHRSVGVAPDAGPEQGYQRFRQAKSVLEAQYGLEFLRRKRVIKPHQYTTDVSPVRIPANGTERAIITISRDADFEVHKFTAVSDYFENLGDPTLITTPAFRGDDFTFRMIIMRKNVDIMNAPVHNLVGTGSNAFPFVLPDSLWLGNASTLRIEFTNRHAFPIEVYFTLSGINYYYREFEQLTNVQDFRRLSAHEREFFVASKKKFIEAYFYTLDRTSIDLGAVGTATANGIETIRIHQDSDFEAAYFLAFSTAGRFRYRLRETNTGRFLTTDFIHSETGVGTGVQPFLLPESLWIDNNSIVEVAFENLDDDPSTIFFTLMGRNWYDVPSMNLTAGPDLFYDMDSALPGPR